MAIAVKAVGGESPTNDASEGIALAEPYTARVTIQGTAALLFHRWSNEAVAEKAAAAKGSRSKKTDNLASYVYRCDNGNLGLPGEYLRQSIIGAARFRQDPRSPRKSAMDLFKAGWSATIELMALLPEYIERATLLEVITSAGRLIGVGDFRPTYGRFQVTSFEAG